MLTGQLTLAPDDSHCYTLDILYIVHVAGCDGRKEETRQRDECKGRIREEFYYFPRTSFFSPKENLTVSNIEMLALIFAHMYNHLGISMEDKPSFKHL